ncbi:MAG TPA: GntR family transcriptional regulator YhfZ [Cellulomonas sp.]
MGVDLAPFLSRNGLAAMQLARRLLALPVGDQLPRVRDMAVDLGCGNGTIQVALELLEQSGAITTRSRGHLGTFLEGADRAMLWELGGLGTLAVAMPLPYSRRYEGLASGLRCAVDQAGLPMSLSYMRGSLDRVAAVVEGRIDVAVTSGLAFDLIRSEAPIALLADLGTQTYVSEHGLVLADGHDETEPGLRVGVDRSSVDQVHLVAQLFAGRTDVSYVEVSYNQLDRAFADGEVEATVWNLDEIDQHLSAPVSVRPLADGLVDGSRNTNAVLVVREGTDRVPPALLAQVDLDLVRTVIQEVLHGRRIPSY